VSAPFYEADLAYVHDAGFGDLARGAAPFVLSSDAPHSRSTVDCRSMTDDALRVTFKLGVVFVPAIERLKQRLRR
jgi:hypothetical protein